MRTGETERTPSRSPVKRRVGVLLATASLAIGCGRGKPAPISNAAPPPPEARPCTYSGEHAATLERLCRHVERICTCETMLCTIEASSTSTHNTLVGQGPAHDAIASTQAGRKHIAALIERMEACLASLPSDRLKRPP
jgi:hypothetical protein